MTYPQQPYFPPAQQPQYAPGYPPAQQPPAYYPQQPQPQYAPPAPPPAQAPAPAVHASIDQFYEQPTASGKSITFDRKPVGFTYTGIVARTLTNADIQAQTDIRDRSRVLTHPDGRPKLVMIVPLQMQPSAEFPDGRAAWYVKGADRAELERAMEAAGCKPGTPPEMGAVIAITYTGERPIPGLNPQKMKQVTYQRPSGAAPAAVVPEPAGAQLNGNGADPYTQQPQYAPAPSQFQGPQYAPPAPPQFQQPQYPAPPEYPAPPQYAPAPEQAPYPQQAQAAPQQAGPAPVAGLSAEQQALLERLTGGQ